MPKVLKTLATISVWVLFIVGVGSLLWSAVELAVSPEEPYHFAVVAWATLAVASVFLAVIAMKIRKDLE